MKTRQDYLDGKISHREYYGQFVTDSIKKTVLQFIGRKKIVLSQDDSFNDIPLARWDDLPTLAPSGLLMHEAGDYLTLAGKVCIYKEAARQIKETV